jgi:hypothetical protein
MVLGNTQARGLRMAAFWMQMPSAKVLMPQRATRKTGCRRATRREFTMIQSAPLMLLPDPDAFVSVKLA